jgi:hypothetical protein
MISSYLKKLLPILKSTSKVFSNIRILIQDEAESNFKKIKPASIEDKSNSSSIIDFNPECIVSFDLTKNVSDSNEPQIVEEALPALSQPISNLLPISETKKNNHLFTVIYWVFLSSIFYFVFVGQPLWNGLTYYLWY